MPEPVAVTLTVADLGVELRVSPQLAAAMHERYAAFVGGEAQLSIDVAAQQFDEPDGGGSVELNVDGSRVALAASGRTRLMVDTQARTGRLTYQPAFETAGPLAPYVGVHTALKSLVSTLLARRGGIMLHAAGLREGARSAVFVGVSGAGKSTVAAMFAAEDVLSDEHVAVTPSESGYLLHSTPFSGTLDCRPARIAAPLELGFHLSQGVQTRVERMSPAEALMPLVACMVVPDGDAETEARAFATAERLSTTVRWNRLHFPINPAAVRKCVSAALAEPT